MTKLRNSIKTRTVLNQSEGLFLDFDRKIFPEQSAYIYNEIVEGFKKKDKVTLIRYCSVPIYDVFLIIFNNRFCLKHWQTKIKQILRFLLFFMIMLLILNLFKVKKLLKKLARIFSHDLHNFNSTVTWHQIMMKMTFDLDGKDVYQYNVFERREVDSENLAWRIAHIE